VAAKLKKEKRLCFGKEASEILKHQPTKARKNRAKSLGINTGREGQQSLGANPISRAVLF